MHEKSRGAGVLLIDTLTPGGPSAVLFRDRETKRYTDPGGGCNALGSETKIDCAQRELEEESLGLFNIDLRSANASKYVIRPYPHYTTFVVPVRLHDHYDKLDRDYRRNLQLVRKHAACAPEVWRESDAMTRVHISAFRPPKTTLINSMRTSMRTTHGEDHLVVKDVHGHPITVDARAVGILHHLVKKMHNAQSLNPNVLDPAPSRSSLGHAGTQLFERTKGLARRYRMFV